jgi:hypothetical protein
MAGWRGHAPEVGGTAPARCHRGAGIRLEAGTEAGIEAGEYRRA